MRLTDWREVYQRAENQLIHEQATRCMNCGIPFCHQGCPLGNLIPTWNDLVHSGAVGGRERGAARDQQLPGVHRPAVPGTVRGGLRARHLRQPGDDQAGRGRDHQPGGRRRRLTPLPARTPSGRTVAVVGSGPAGLAAAQQLARAGHAVTVYERSDRIGGLLRYGIPDFKLEKHHIDRRLEQLRRRGRAVRDGCNVGVDITAPSCAPTTTRCCSPAAHSTRATSATRPGGSSTAIHLAMEYLEGPTGSSPAPGRPPIDAAGKHVIVLGGGDTAADCLGTAHRHGAASVHLIEVMPEPPATRDTFRNPWPTWPVILRTASAHEEGGTRIFGVGRAGVPRQRGRNAAAVRSWTWSSTVGGFSVTEVPGTERELPADLVLLAIGFGGTEAEPLFDQLGLDPQPARHDRPPTPTGRPTCRASSWPATCAVARR